MEDRRKFQRFGCSLDRPFQITQKERFFGAIRDFSRGGFSFFSKQKLRERDQLNLNLEIAGLERRVPVGIEIVWSKPRLGEFAYGVRFTDILPADKFDIMDLLYQDWRKTLSADSLLR